MQCEFEVLLLALSLSLEASCLGVMLAAWCVCVCVGSSLSRVRRSALCSFFLFTLIVPKR